MRQLPRLFTVLIALAALISFAGCNDTIVIPATEATTTEAKGRPNPWVIDNTVEEALTHSGIDKFEISPDIKIGDETIHLQTIKSTDGIIEEEYFYGAVRLIVRKGRADAVYSKEEITGDFNSYLKRWDCDIEGVTVHCKGERDDAATVSYWEEGDYLYAVMAYGEGGDTGYGLNKDELALFVKGLR
ncbi:MAG: hypothetical protein J5778_09960 [Clostridiales bacterium]|nr:hypothetical protein [Clostridiales bacterium]